MQYILEGKKTEIGILVGMLWAGLNQAYPDVFNPTTEIVVYGILGALTTWAAVIRRKRELKAKGVK